MLAEAAGRLELVELSAGVLLALLRGVLVGEVSLMRNVSAGLKSGEGDERRTLCPPATRLIWLEGMSSAARMEEDIVIEEGGLVWLVELVELSREVLVICMNLELE